MTLTVLDHLRHTSLLFSFSHLKEQFRYPLEGEYLVIRIVELALLEHCDLHESMANSPLALMLIWYPVEQNQMAANIL